MIMMIAQRHHDHKPFFFRVRWGRVGRLRPPCYHSDQMTQVQITRFGGPDVLRVVERPAPVLPPGHVRVAVKAAGVNFADVQMRMGLYPEAPRVPFVPGYEVAGIVSEAGPGAERFRVGERVLAACRFGGYASEVVLPVRQVRSTPRHLSDAEAAAVPVAFLTAWIALKEMARVREGDRVLVPGAAGGVGSAIVQIAADAGARVTGLVGSPEKKAAVLSLGARQVFTYAELAADGGAAGRGFSLVLDPRGGAALRDSMRRLAPGARVVCYGVSSLVAGPRRSIRHVLLQLMRMPRFNPIGLSMANNGVFGLNMLKLFDTEEGLTLLMKAMDGVLEGVCAHRYKPIIGGTFPLSEAGAAHASLQSRSNIGKIVLICS
jgi:NADPH:quinone reductase-like Zn-dependent oxidoreductase